MKDEVVIQKKKRKVKKPLGHSISNNSSLQKVSFFYEDVSSISGNPKIYVCV